MSTQSCVPGSVGCCKPLWDATTNCTFSYYDQYTVFGYCYSLIGVIITYIISRLIVPEVILKCIIKRNSMSTVTLIFMLFMMIVRGIFFILSFLMVFNNYPIFNYALVLTIFTIGNVAMIAFGLLFFILWAKRIAKLDEINLNMHSLRFQRLKFIIYTAISFYLFSSVIWLLIVIFQAYFQWSHLFFNVENGIYALFTSLGILYYSLITNTPLGPQMKRRVPVMISIALQSLLLVVTVVIYGILIDSKLSAFNYWTLNSVIRIQEFLLVFMCFLVIQKKTFPSIF